jgi:RNA polymerase sigma factor (sigma-70 family)
MTFASLAILASRFSRPFAQPAESPAKTFFPADVTRSALGHSYKVTREDCLVPRHLPGRQLPRSGLELIGAYHEFMESCHRLERLGIPIMSSSNDDERKVTLAQQYCMENWQWVLQQCRSFLKGKRVPNYVDLAQDLAQTVFVQLASVSNERWEQQKNRPGYLYRTLEHAANGHYYKTWREETVDPSDFMNALNRQGQNAAEKKRAALLLEELRAMCTDQERSLLESLYEDCKYPAIAANLGITEAALRKRISRLNGKLRQLARDDKDPP